LYKEVLDNKEPLFYYFVAAQRLVGAYGEIFGEFVVLSTACYSVYKLGLSVLNKNLSLLTGWIYRTVYVNMRTLRPRLHRVARNCAGTYTYMQRDSAKMGVCGSVDGNIVMIVSGSAVQVKGLRRRPQAWR
jgi:hypothetical protein